MPVTISGSSPTFSSGYQGGTIISGTAQASTSGTSIDFTSIPSWVKRVTICFGNVSTSGSSFKLVQIGAGSVTTSGYASQSSFIGSAVNTTTSTAGFVINSGSASEFVNGHCVLTLISSNTWACSLTVTTYSAGMTTGAGYITLSGALDRVRITTVNGTDTFDAGTINILYE